MKRRMHFWSNTQIIGTLQFPVSCQGRPRHFLTKVNVTYQLILPVTNVVNTSTCIRKEEVNLQYHFTKYLIKLNTKIRKQTKWKHKNMQNQNYFVSLKLSYIKSFRHDNATLSLMYDVCFSTVADPEVNTAVGGGGVLETQSCRVWDGVRQSNSIPDALHWDGDRLVL